MVISDLLFFRASMQRADLSDDIRGWTRSELSFAFDKKLRHSARAWGVVGTDRFESIRDSSVLKSRCMVSQLVARVRAQRYSAAVHCIIALEVVRQRLTAA